MLLLSIILYYLILIMSKVLVFHGEYLYFEYFHKLLLLQLLLRMQQLKRLLVALFYHAHKDDFHLLDGLRTLNQIILIMMKKYLLLIQLNRLLVHKNYQIFQPVLLILLKKISYYAKICCSNCCFF